MEGRTPDDEATGSKPDLEGQSQYHFQSELPDGWANQKTNSTDNICCQSDLPRSNHGFISYLRIVISIESNACSTLTIVGILGNYSLVMILFQLIIPITQQHQIFILKNTYIIIKQLKFGAMDIEVDRQKIINKFRRNGHSLSRNSLELVTQHLKNTRHPNKKLDEVIKKIDQMCIIEQQQFNDANVKLAIQLLNHRTEKGKSFKSFEKFIQHLKQWTIFYLTPYETKERFLVDKPDPSLFSFQPSDFVEMNYCRFKAIRQYNTLKIHKQNQQKTNDNFVFIGVLYQKHIRQISKIMLQNEINEVHLIFPAGYKHEILLIPGCVYIAQGSFKNMDLQLTVNKISLPYPLPPAKNSLMNEKLKLVSQNISLSKDGIDFSKQDFVPYDFIYNKQENKGKPIAIFGNFQINLLQTEKIKNIIKQFEIQCLILLLGEEDHEQIDLKKQIGDKIPIYIIPHINSEGPRILPKIPILKNFYNAKVLTNPARISIQGKQCLFLNYPLVKNFYTKSLNPKEVGNITPEQMGKQISQMLYSQNNVGLTHKFYWKQSSYFNVNSGNFIFLSDKACFQFHTQRKQGDESKGLFVSVGNFAKQKQFVLLLPHSKQKPIHLSSL